MQNCSVAVPFQQVQYLVHEVSWPKMPYNQSQCSVLMGGSKDDKSKLNTFVWEITYHTCSNELQLINIFYVFLRANKTWP